MCDFMGLVVSLKPQNLILKKMKFLLKLKHWQLFGITWGFPIMLNIFTFSDPGLMITSFPILMIVFALGTFGWIWAIPTNIHSKLPEGVNLNLKRFKILFRIPLIYIGLITGWMGIVFGGGASLMTNINPAAIAGVIVPLHLLSLGIIIWGIRFAAKTLKSIEIGRVAKFGDYAGEFFLIWFSIIGYWVLQPRLNKLVEKEK